MNKTKIKIQIYLVIIFFGGLLRFWMLPELPNGLNLQEVGGAYDAFSLAAFGVDRYTYAHPIYFMGYGQGQGTIYTYLLAELIKLFGVSTLVIRIPMACLSILTLLVGMRLIHKLEWGDFYEYLFGILFAILPVFVTSARIGDGANTIAFFSLAFLYTLTCAIRDNNWFWWLMAGILGGLALYTSGMAFLFIPIFLIPAWIYIIWCRGINIRKGLLFLAPFLVLAVPIIVLCYINWQELDTLVVWKFTIPNLFAWSKDNLQTFDLTSVDVALAQVFGADPFHIYSKPAYGMYTWLGLPFALIGFLKAWGMVKSSIKERNATGIALVWLWIVAVLVAMGFINQYEINTWHLYGIYAPALLLIVLGVKTLVEYASEKRQVVLKSVIAIAFLCYAALFLKSYFVERENYYMFQPLFAEAMSEIKEKPELAGRMLYVIDYKEPQMYYDLSALHDPRESVQNVTFGYNGIPDINGIYIISEPYYEMIPQLEEVGVEKKQQYQNYMLLYKD